MVEKYKKNLEVDQDTFRKVARDYLIEDPLYKAQRPNHYRTKIWKPDKLKINDHVIRRLDN